MLPEAKSDDLLYVAADEPPAVYVFSYPSGKEVGTLYGLTGHAQGLCADSEGDVFVTEFDFGEDRIDEYAHGATSPSLTLTAPVEPNGCSIDPATGNLAVALYYYGSSSAGVAIYAAAQGNPTIYSVSNMTMSSPSYDTNGNLFVSGANAQGFQLVELPKGSSTFTSIAINSTIFKGKYWEPIQWNAGNIAVGIPGGEGLRDYIIYRVAVSGSTGTVVGKTTLRLRRGDFYVDNAFCIQGAKVAVNSVINGFDGREVVWPYPRGGTRLGGTGQFGNQYIDAVTVSVAASR